MRPDWAEFINNLISEIEANSKTSWGKYELVAFIKDREIQFLQKALDVVEEGYAV